MVPACGSPCIGLLKFETASWAMVKFCRVILKLADKNINFIVCLLYREKSWQSRATRLIRVDDVMA